MNKKMIALVLIVLVVGATVWLFLQTSARITHKKQVEANLQTLPNVQLVDLDSTAFGLHAWAGQRSAVVFYFDPHCEHCQHEAIELKKQAQAFKDAQLLWLSTERLWVLRAFEKEYALQKTIPSLTIAQISPQAADKQFGFRTVPTILIYDAEGNLAKKYVGETKMDAIIKYLNR